MIIASDFFTFMAVVRESQPLLIKGRPHNRRMVRLCELFRGSVWCWFPIGQKELENMRDIKDTLQSRIYKYSCIVKVLYQENLIDKSTLHNISAIISKTMKGIQEMKHLKLCLDREKILWAMTIKIMYGVIK